MGRTVEELYADAFAAAERGKTLVERPTDAIAAFEEAIRILSRLAIVESAAKRELVQSAVNELRSRVQQLQSPSPPPPPSGGDTLHEDNSGAPEQPSDVALSPADDFLTRAMDIHEEARTLEADGQLEDCIERFLSAGDW
ncbi:hypothetical protein PINS_up009887 [Pythium insidiosum]|nr:hypothetical protein PINS_up009887 [Pythium insidiosum]